MSLFFQFFQTVFIKTQFLLLIFVHYLASLFVVQCELVQGGELVFTFSFFFRVVVRDNKEGRGVVVCFVELEVSSSHYSRLYQRE